MLEPFQHITDLSEICYSEGIENIVISPGSRNAPLTEAFYFRFRESCYSIVDERSAGYFALGMARYSRKPAVLICTSGTAVLNYSPAIAEAYYSQVPLLVITADRPAEWIDQQNNQAIRQKEVYRNFIKKSYHLAENPEEQQELRETHRQVYEAIQVARSHPKGPVHLNVPLSEPLYTALPIVSAAVSSNLTDHQNQKIVIPDDLKQIWQHAERIMIVHGQDHPKSGVSELLSKLSELPGVVVLAENISNVNADSVITQTELLFSHAQPASHSSPDLLLYSGGQVVSKHLKTYLRNLQNVSCWRIGIDDYDMDTFKQNNSIFSCLAEQAYTQLLQISRRAKSHSEYVLSWKEAEKKSEEKRNILQDNLPFSDVWAVKQVLEKIPQNSILELGNSSTVRITQFFSSPKEIELFSNRGVSGIDGCLSAASGTATASGKFTVAVLGDSAFIYDSNALWNKRLSPHFRAIVLNNRGGGIFSLLEGPPSRSSYEEFFIAWHPVDIEKLARAFNIRYFCCSDKESLKMEMHHFFQPADRAGILEIKTETENNVKAYRMMLGKDSID